ncbi:probable glycosyltransferase At5g11130 isoform X2 [Andrographis paniculata]|uniref:probable glycosyltransferase At5g11130 isoform X2 n=1 Tax=Andrographis paniculata TaxID=175694 RepID=UPI0021E73B13|nr:probable glycosyltransferase At5g11130 isoform X2 [Andrographis paniculata]
MAAKCSGPTQIVRGNRPFVEFSRINPPLSPQPSHAVVVSATQKAGQSDDDGDDPIFEDTSSSLIAGFQEPARLPSSSRQQKQERSIASENDEVFHDRSLFLQDYSQMNRSFRIYIYPHSKDDPFANVLLPVDDEPSGNYASEAYFKDSLFRSHFLTIDPSEADLFYLPFSIASLRSDRRVGINRIQDFIRSYIANISSKYPFWNRTGGADHFYVACHSIGRSAMEKAVQVKLNAIQIWPRKALSPSTSLPSQRKKLAFYAGAMNSRVREFLVRTWQNDSDISVHHSRLKTSYSKAFLESKFCIHAKGFEVNTARIGDALYYGCVPVILADHYDLPYADILNWGSFSVVVPTEDIPNLKVILGGIRAEEYLRLQRNVVRVQKHFLWHRRPADYDAFHMVMFELWLRRGHVRTHAFDS